MVYIELFHGRKKGEELDDWGSEGPIFGPYDYFHTTYATEIKFGAEGHVLNIYDEMVYYDGVYYGDWSVFHFVGDNKDLERIVNFDQKKANLDR